jgi:hypothetical protein
MYPCTSELLTQSIRCHPTYDGGQSNWLRLRVDYRPRVRFPEGAPPFAPPLAAAAADVAANDVPQPAPTGRPVWIVQSG